MSDVNQALVQIVSGHKFDTIVILRINTGIALGWCVALGKYSPSGVSIVDSPIGDSFPGNNSLAKALQYARDLKKFFDEVLPHGLPIHLDPLTLEESGILETAKQYGDIGYRT